MTKTETVAAIKYATQKSTELQRLRDAIAKAEGELSHLREEMEPAGKRLDEARLAAVITPSPKADALVTKLKEERDALVVRADALQEHLDLLQAAEPGHRAAEEAALHAAVKAQRDLQATLLKADHDANVTKLLDAAAHLILELKVGGTGASPSTAGEWFQQKYFGGGGGIVLGPLVEDLTRKLLAPVNTEVSR